jgi:hypothetical protein
MSIQKYVANEVVQYLKEREKERDDLTKLVLLLETKHRGRIHKCVNANVKEGCEGWYYTIELNDYWRQVHSGSYKRQGNICIYYCEHCSNSQ